MARMSMAVAPGTGPAILGTAIFGYQSFSAAGAVDGESFSYNISDFNTQGILTAWEVGTGTYAVAGPTLTRAPLYSSNGNAAINASALAQAWITALATDFAGQAPDTVGNSLVATGVDQPTALVLLKQFNEILTVAPGTGVLIPSFMATPGSSCKVVNYGANNLLIYPLVGQTFFSGGVSNGLNEPIQLNAGQAQWFEASSPTTVYTLLP
jgi:hypothetical protein